MQIIPYVGDTIVSSDTVSIQVNPRDRERADDLVLSTSTIVVVKDERSFKIARDAMGQLKSMFQEITAGEKGAKTPFTAIVNKIGTLARDVGDPVKAEYDRIQALTNRYVAHLEALEAKRREEARRAEAEAQAKIREAQKQAALAQSEKEQTRARLAAANAQLALAEAQAKREAQEREPKSLAPGGRVTHPWRFELLDPEATVIAGGKRLLRFELDILACQDAVKVQLETNPDQPPTLPGIRVSRETKIFVKAS